MESLHMAGQGLSPGNHPSMLSTFVTRGRVSFEQFFRICFGEAASILKDGALAMHTCCASNLLRDALEAKNLTSRSPFLGQAGAIHGKASYGLTESMIAWFPELRQQAPRFKRFKSLSDDESRKGFDEASRLLQQQCQCFACSKGTSNPASQFCKLTLAEVIFNLGFYIRLMVITPKFYPKRNGIHDFYSQYHTTRLSTTTPDPITSSSSSSSTTFINRLTTRLTSSLNMLQISALLFANAPPSDLNTSATDMLGITSSSLTVYLAGYRQFLDKDQEQNDQRAASLLISPGWICLFEHEVRFEVYEPAYLKLSFEEIWENARSRAMDLRQMLKWEGRAMVTSFVRRGDREEEERARADGWILL